MHSRKILFLYFKRIQKELINENHTLDLDVPKSNPHGEDKDRNHRSLVNLKSSTWWLEPWSWHTFDGKEKRVEAMALNLSR